MYTEQTEKMFKWAIAIILIVGFAAGIGVGLMFMEPTEMALEYSYYADEKEWSWASTIAMLCVWGSSYLMAVAYHGLHSVIEILDEIRTNTKTEK